MNQTSKYILILFLSSGPAKAETFKELCENSSKNLKTEVSDNLSEFKEAIGELIRAFRAAQTDAQIEKLDALCKSKDLWSARYKELQKKFPSHQYAIKNSDGSFEILSKDNRELIESQPDAKKWRQTQVDMETEVKQAWERAQSRVKGIILKLKKNGISFRFLELSDLDIELVKPMKDDANFGALSDKTYELEMQYNYCSDKYMLTVLKGPKGKQVDPTVKSSTSLSGHWFWTYHERYGCPENPTFGTEFGDRRNSLSTPSLREKPPAGMR